MCVCVHLTPGVSVSFARNMWLLGSDWPRKVWFFFTQPNIKHGLSSGRCVCLSVEPSQCLNSDGRRASGNMGLYVTAASSVRTCVRPCVHVCDLLQTRTLPTQTQTPFKGHTLSFPRPFKSGGAPIPALINNCINYASWE